MEDIFKKVIEADSGVRLGSCDIENLCAESGKTVVGIGRGSGNGRLKKALAEARRAIDGVRLEACHGIAVCLFAGSVLCYALQNAVFCRLKDGLLRC